MKRLNIFIISLKKNILSILFILFTICLVVFSKQNLHATQEGLLLCANSVIPALFPFFIATELLSYTNIIPFIGKKLNKFMRPIFRVPGEGAYAFLMGIISGYPVGAKIVTNMRNQNHCTKAEGERLLAFTNNSGPLFIIGTVGISLFGNTTIGILLFLTHVLACVTVGVLFRFWKYSKKEKNFSTAFSYANSSNIAFKDLGDVLSKSISSAISSVVLIGGFVVFFSVVISILNTSGCIYFLANIFSPIFKFFGIPTEFVKCILSGIIELTNGLKQVTNIPIKNISLTIIICAFLLGFGGISILLQVFSIISKSDLSIKPYFIGKFAHGIFAAFYTYLFINWIPYFNFDITPVFSSNTIALNSSGFTPNIFSFCFFVFAFIFFLFYFLRLKWYKRRKAQF